MVDLVDQTKDVQNVGQRERERLESKRVVVAESEERCSRQKDVTFVTVVTDGDGSVETLHRGTSIDGFNVMKFTGVYLQYRSLIYSYVDTNKSKT